MVRKCHTPHYDDLNPQLYDAGVTEHYQKENVPGGAKVQEDGFVTPVTPSSAPDAVF
ncbi:hypothetical protein GCM10009131_22620 [Morganella psychrotolerans]